MLRKFVFTSLLLTLVVACGGINTSTEKLPLEGSSLSDSSIAEIGTEIETEIEIETTEPISIQHVMIPEDLPKVHSGAVGDQDSSITADEYRAPSGDRFTFGRFERPFIADTMDIYYPALDIQSALFYEDPTWLYATLNFKDDNSSYVLDGKYGFEIDLDVDGGGEWLVLVSQPASTEWSTDGVEVWFDTNNDVGGSTYGTSDDVLSDGNGYETQVFGAGIGDDVDLAWARISPDDPYVVQLAVKRTILNGDVAYMVGMWAGTDDLEPSLFDFNDHYTHEQAGASLVEFEYFYPIKELSELDNTCRMAIGFQPTGKEPGICPLPPKTVPDDDTPPPPPPDTDTSCPPQYEFCVPFGNQIVCYCLEP